VDAWRTGAIRESADFHGSRLERRSFVSSRKQKKRRIYDYANATRASDAFATRAFTEHYEILELSFGSRSVGNQLEENNKRGLFFSTELVARFISLLFLSTLEEKGEKMNGAKGSANRTGLKQQVSYTDATCTYTYTRTFYT